MVILGKISGVFGVKGQVKVFSYTEPRENILDYNPWMLDQQGSWQAREIESGQLHGKGIVARLRGCEDRDQAQALVGHEIAVPREQLPATAADEYYWADLQGLTVITQQGVILGRISHLFETGSNDVMVVKGDREILIPYIRRQVVKSVDLDTGEMQVDWDPAF